MSDLSDTQDLRPCIGLHTGCSLFSTAPEHQA